MSARLEKIEDSQATVKLEIAEDRFEEGLQYSYKKVVREVNLPGFRKGKAPRQLVEAQFGRENLYEDALEYVLPLAFAEAITELKLEPIARPDYDFDDIEPGKPVIITVTVAVRPEVVLGPTEGIQVEIPSFAVEEQQVEALLADMRGRYAESYEKVDEPAEDGDSLLINFTGYIDDTPFSGGDATDYPLVLGSNSFIPGFEAQLVGAKTGEEVEVKVAFPEEYHAEDLKGKDAVFKVTVNKIQGRKLRDLDDEFAQEISEYESLEELKQNIRKDLEATGAKNRENAIQDQVFNKLLETSELVIAPPVIEEEADQMLEQFDHRLHHQGFSLERYLGMVGNTLEQFREEMKTEAERNVKKHFILEKTAEEKGIQVTDEELENKINELAQQSESSLEETKAALGDSIGNLKLNMLLEKAAQSLVATAVVTETVSVGGEQDN
jgi:trigger factor